MKASLWLTVLVLFAGCEETLSVPPVVLALRNSANVEDSVYFHLKNTEHLLVTQVRERNLLLASGPGDDGFSVFEIQKDGTLASRLNIHDEEDPRYALEGAGPMVMIHKDEKTFLIVAGRDENALNSFELKPNISLELVDVVGDDATVHLRSPQTLVSTERGGKSFVFVSSANDDGVSVFEILANGRLVARHHRQDGDDPLYALDGAMPLCLVEVDGTLFLLVGGGEEAGVTVFDVADDGSLSSRFHLRDSMDAQYLLQNPQSIVARKWGGQFLIFLAGEGENGINVFHLKGDGSLEGLEHLQDDDGYNIAGVAQLHTVRYEKKLYLIATGRRDDGLSLFEVGPQGSLTNVVNIDDGDGMQFLLQEPVGIEALVLDKEVFVFVASSAEHGISIFQISEIPQGSQQSF